MPSNAGALKLQDLLTLSSDLDAHVLDFTADELQIRHRRSPCLAATWILEQNKNKMTSC